jgi:hypothetical protein
MVEQQPSKLNTRVRFPSPAPMFSGTSGISKSHSEPQAAAHSVPLISFCTLIRFFCLSRGAPLLRSGRDLIGGALDVSRQYLDRSVPTLRHDLAIGQAGVAGLGEAAMAERRERQFVAQAGGSDHFLHLARQVGEVGLIRLRPCRPWSAIAPMDYGSQLSHDSCRHRLQPFNHSDHIDRPGR